MMSFSFRDKPRLSERLRGKSSDQVFEDFEKEFQDRSKMLFEDSPSWKSERTENPFNKAGFPFDDDMTRGHHGIRSHLEDLAQRHPEFAEHLRCPPWGGDVENRATWGRKRKDSGDDSSGGATYSGNNIPRSSSGSQENQSADNQEARGQRSSSAPPDGRAANPEQPPRYVSRININPVNPSDPATMSGSPDGYGKPPVAPKPQSPQQSGKSTPTKQPSNVRHIPIFVEGRDEPILPKACGDNYRSASPPSFPQPQQAPQSFSQPQQSKTTHTFARPSQFTSTHQFRPQSPSRTIPIPVKIEKTTTKPSQAQPPQSPQQNPPEPPQKQEPPSQPTKPQQPPATDPLSKVNAVKVDVEELMAKVEQYSGNSRKDKGYIYLDEMLTRNLLKLDDIDTEGKENVRQARKDVIKLINKCIGILESKVPVPEEQVQSEPMEAEECRPAADNTVVPQETASAENQVMEIEQTVSEQPAVSEEKTDSTQQTVSETKMDVEQTQPVPETSQPADMKTEVLTQVEETGKEEKMEAENLEKPEENVVESNTANDPTSENEKVEETTTNTLNSEKMEVEIPSTVVTEAATPVPEQTEGTTQVTDQVTSEGQVSENSNVTSTDTSDKSVVQTDTPAAKSPKSPGKKGKAKKSPKKS